MNEGPLTTIEKNNFSPKANINSELLFFKNDILGDIKQVESKISKRMEKQNEESEKKLVHLQHRLDSLTQKLFSLSNITSENTYTKEKVDSLYQFRSKVEETINSYDFRLKTLSKDLVETINKYDRIIEGNLYYQGIIGSNNARFRTFHNFVDYVLSNISQLNIFKDKTFGVDFKQYKTKLDSMVEGLKKQTEDIINNNKVYTNICVEQLEKKVKSDFNLYDQKMFDLKIKNSEQCKDLEKLTQNLIKEWERIAEIKREIDLTFGKNSELFKNHFLLTENKLNECINDYNELKRKFDLLVEYLKGMRGGVGSNMTFKEFVQMKENDPNFHKKKSSAFSVLKKYIVGEMGMEQITHLPRKYTRKSYGKKNSNPNFSVNNFPQSSKFIRKNTMNVMSRMNSNSNIYTNINNEQNKLNKSNSQAILVVNNITNNLKEKVQNNNINTIEEEKAINKEGKIKYAYKRYKTSNFNNYKSTENEEFLKVDSQEKIFKNNIITLNKNFNNNPENNNNKIKLENQTNNNIVNKSNDNIIKNEEIKEKEKEKDLVIKNKSILIQKNKNNVQNNNDKNENKNDINNEEKKIKFKGRVKFSDIDYTNKNEQKINNKGYSNSKILVSNHINEISFYGKEQKTDKKFNVEENINYMILNKDNNNINSSKDNLNINKNYDFNIIVENNEKEEKEEEKESINILEKENNLFQKQQNKNSKDYEINYNYNFNNYESMSDFPNTNIFLPKNNSLDIEDLKMNNNNPNKEFGKIKEKQKQKNRTIDSNNINYNIGKNLINEENRVNLHKLLRGDVNVLTSMKIINKGEELKILKINNTDKKAKKNEKKINLNDIKMPFRSNSSINFFQSSNPVNKLNYELFEDVIKSKDIEDYYDYNYDINLDLNDSRDNINKNYMTKKVNKMNNTEFRNASSNSNNRSNKNKQKVHIVNLPGILDYKTIDQKEKSNENECDDYNEAFNQILELRKINYENDLYRKKIGPNINKNSRNNNNEYGNKIKVYNGINNNYYRNEISTYDDINNIRLKKMDINK